MRQKCKKKHKMMILQKERGNEKRGKQKKVKRQKVRGTVQKKEKASRINQVRKRRIREIKESGEEKRIKLKNNKN